MSPIKLRFIERLKLFKKKLAVSWRFHFAHHPLCDAYSDHVWWFKGIYLCQGCTLTILGILFSFITFFLVNPFMILWQWIGFASTILCLLFIVEIAQIENRMIKRFIRFFTGFGLGAFFWFILGTTNIMILGVAILFTYAGYKVFKKIRVFKPAEDKCKHCPEMQKSGVCSGLYLEYEAEKKYSEYATELLYDRLRHHAKLKHMKRSRKMPVPVPREDIKEND